MTKKLEVTKWDTVTRMTFSITEYAGLRGVDISGITLDNFNSYLDDQFGDGGEARCEKFCDLAWEYAAQFGEMESRAWNNAQWSCIESAIKRLERQFSC